MSLIQRSRDVRSALRSRQRGMLLNPYRFTSVITDSDAAAWKTAVIANSGTVSDATLLAVSDFCVAAKANGYWTKLTRINLFCGNQLEAALVPLKAGGGNATDTNSPSPFLGSDYTEATGLSGTRFTAHLNTGLVANTLTANSTHLASYSRSSSSSQHNGIALGASVGSNTLQLYAPYSDSNVYSDQYSATGGAGRVSGAITTPFGFVIGTRTSSSLHTIYRNGSSVASNTTTGGSLPADSIFVFAGSSSGSAIGRISATLAAYSIGAGLSSSDVTAYNADMQAFQTALGRNV